MQNYLYLLVRSESYINDVTNTSLIDNKANRKGNCHKDDINILAPVCACMCVRYLCACARARACLRIRTEAPLLTSLTLYR